MNTALQQFQNTYDNGSTPYLMALNSVYNTIASDPDLQSTGSNAPLYYVIFLSDGYPTDALNSDGSVNQGTITNSITHLLSLAPSRIVLSSVYYGTINDNAAASTIQNMANSGHGDFINVDTATTSTINIDNLIQAPCGH